ncbi:hypothetical protein Tco_0665866, partial [Tanacetum coccineum]
DTEDKPDDQELEAHYMYMTKFQEVDSNVTLDSSNMSTNERDVDQNVVEHENERDLLYVVLLSFNDINEYSEMACKYLGKIEECERLETEVPRSHKQKHDKNFAQLEQHCINLELALQHAKEKKCFDSNEEEVVPKVDDVCLVDGVFDGAFGGDGDEDFVMGEGVVVSSSSLDRPTKSCLGGIMVSLIFLEGLEEEVCVDAIELEE